MLPVLLGEGPEARGHLGFVARGVDLEPARPQQDLLEPLFIAVAGRVGDNIERAVGPDGFDGLLRLPREERILPEVDMVLSKRLEERAAEPDNEKVLKKDLYDNPFGAFSNYDYTLQN